MPLTVWSVHCGHFLSAGGHPVQSENDFCAAIGSEEKLFSLFCFGLAPPGVKNKKSRKARLQ